jgi:hypothetical protein
VNCIPPEFNHVAQIEILSEVESPGCWRFDVQVLDNLGMLRRHAVTLAWADYNLWSQDGADEPSRVLDAVLNLLLTHVSASDLPAKFDASLARRRIAGADQVIPTLIGK